MVYWDQRRGGEERVCHPRGRLLRNGSFPCVKYWDTQSLCENDLNSNEGTNDLWVAYWAQRKWMWMPVGHLGPGRASTYKSLGVPSWTRMGFYEWLSLNVLVFFGVLEHCTDCL